MFAKERTATHRNRVFEVEIDSSDEVRRASGVRIDEVLIVEKARIARSFGTWNGDGLALYR